MKPNYFVLSLNQQGQCILNPIDGYHQFRPSFEHVDIKEDKKTSWKKVINTYQDDSAQSAHLRQDMLSTHIDEDTSMLETNDYLDQVAPLTVRVLADDFSTCSLSKDNGRPNLSSEYLAKTCEGDWRLMCLKIMRKAQVLEFR